jgi:hypothetical protein
MTDLLNPRSHRRKLEKMKNMKRTIYGIVLTLIITGSAFGQTIDQKRMDRDLEIAENILQTLSNSEGNRLYVSHDTESSYVPDYGVIFRYPSNNFRLRTVKGSNGNYVISGSASGGNIIVAPSDEGSSYAYSYNVTTDHDDDCDDCPDQKELEEKLKEQTEDWAKKSEEMFKEHATAFLVDYADLIGQLKSTDKIMITSKSKNGHVGWMDDADKRRQSTGRTAEILKSDLIAYKQGKATRVATAGKIKFASTVKDEKVERDLEMFGSIFAKLYDADLSNTYYTSSRRVNYERLDNFGAIYSMRVYSSSQDNGRHTIRTTRESRLTQEERDQKVNAMYPEFERSVKENILDYGRTIKSLKPNEMLMFKIRLTECKGCEMPRSIEVSVKANILTDYGFGKITKAKALESITLKKSSN